MNTRNLLFVDLETTGLSAHWNEITEAAWILSSPDGKVVLAGGSVQVVVDHPERLSPEAQKINGFDALTHNTRIGTWGKNALAAKIASISEGTCLAGHGVNFDESFLSELLRTENYTPKWHYQSVDTQKLAWPLFLKGRIDGVSLKHLVKYFNLGDQGAVHNALNDITLTREVFLKLIELYSAAIP